MSYKVTSTLAWLLLFINIAFALKRFRDVVTNSPCNQQTCQLQPGGTIHCCFLKPLNDLNQIVDVKSVTIPSSLRLHIMFVDNERALCTDLDAFHPIAGITSKKNTDIIKKCSGAFKLKTFSNGLFKRLSGLTIRQTELQYISETVFDFFPQLRHLVIEENTKLNQIPAVNGQAKKMLQTIHYTGNPNVRAVKWNEKIALSSLREFVFTNFKVRATESPTLSLNMGVFTPGKNFSNFIMRLNYQKVNIKLPAVKKDDNIQSVFIGTSNIPENLHVDFNKTKGTIEQLVYNFPVKPEQIFPNLLPYDLYERFGSVDVHYDNENFELKSLTFYNSIPTERVIKVRTRVDESELMDISHRLARPKKMKKSGNKVYLQYIILTSDELLRVVKDTQKQYIVKTHFLWVRNVDYLRKSIKIHLRYNFLILSKKAALFSADIQSPVDGRTTVNKDYRSTFSTSELWESFDLEQIYEFLTTAVNIARRGIDVGEERGSPSKSIKHQLVSTMLNSVDEVKVLTVARYMSPAVTKMQYHYVEDALHRVHKLIAFARNSVAQSKQVVGFTARRYQEKTVLLQGLTRTLITSERYEKNAKLLLSGNKLLFDAAKTRIDLLRNVAKEESEKRVRDERFFRSTLAKIKTLRKKYENDLQMVKKRFYEIVKNKSKVAKFTHLAYVLDAIMDLFSEKFNTKESFLYGKSKTENSNLIQDLGKSLSTIYSVLRKIKDLQALIVRKFVRMQPRKYDVLEHKDPEKHMVTYFDMRKKQVIHNEGFSFEDSIMITNKLHDINVQDMLRWDTVMKQLDQLLDTSISQEIPETLAFKTTLLRLMDISKVETQAMYDIAKVQAEIFLGNYTEDVYSMQLSQISKELKTYTDEGEEISSIRANLEDEFMTTRALSITQLKIDLFLHLQDYCSWVEYNTLQECTLAQQFNFDISLSTLLYLTNELLVAPILPTTQEPTSQSFIDLPIRYKFDGQCEEITKVVNNAYTDAVKANKKKNKRKSKQKQTKKNFHFHKKTNPTIVTGNSFISTNRDVNPPLLTWPVPFSGNFPIMFDPLNATSGYDEATTGLTYKKTRVEPNITIVDAPDIMLQQGDDDFMQVEGLVDTNKDGAETNVRTGNKQKVPHARAANGDRIKASHGQTRAITANKTSVNAVSTESNAFDAAKATEKYFALQPSTTSNFNRSINNYNNTTTQNNNTVEETTMSGNVVNSTSNLTSPQNITSTSSATTSSKVKETTIADVAENVDNEEKDVKAQVLADWIGERIIENEIRKHKAIQQNSEKRSNTMVPKDDISKQAIVNELDMMGNSAATNIESDLIETTNDTKRQKVASKTHINSAPIAKHQNSLTESIRAKLNNSTQIVEGTHYNTMSPNGHNKRRKRRKKHKLHGEANGVQLGGIQVGEMGAMHAGVQNVMTGRMQNGIRVRRSNNDDYNFTTNIFNNDLSLYMVTNGIESREQFETMFRKCNASKVVELKENNFATVSLSLFNKQFKPFDRVRIEEAKVFLHGAKTNTGFLEVKIESESILQDRLGDKRFTFTAAKWSRAYRYKIPDKPERATGYEIKADIHRNRNQLALLPTPFTTWVISVSSEHNPGLDLSGLTAIEFLFTGSFVANPQKDIGKDIPGFFQNIKKEKQDYLKEQNKNQKQQQKHQSKKIKKNGRAKNFVAKKNKG